MSDPIASLGLSCPSGGSFYICQGNTTQFLGCCTSDPCSDGKGECPQADLRYSSFDKDDYSEIGTQACANSTGAWYTCTGTTEAFLGCCSSNACGGTAGCAEEDLVAARLSDTKSAASAFLTTTATASGSGTSSTGVVSSAASSAGATATTDAAGPAPSGDVSGLSTGAKAGIGIGGALIAVALVGVLLYFTRACMKDRRGVVVTLVRRSSDPTPSAIMGAHPDAPYQYYDSDRMLHPPPAASTGVSRKPYDSVPANKSPGPGYESSYSAQSSPSSDAFHRQPSVRSASNNALGITPSPSLDGSPDQRQQQQWASPQQFLTPGHYARVPQYAGPPQQSPPLEALAELDATGPPGRTSENPSVSSTYPSATFRPYRPPE